MRQLLSVWSIASDPDLGVAVGVAVCFDRAVGVEADRFMARAAAGAD